MSARSNPFEEIERFFERMRRQFEGTWESGEPAGEWSSAFAPPPIDLVENDDAFVATVDLPGFDREDVTVRVADRVLYVEAEREQRVDDTGEEYLRRERRHESTRRSIQLPEEVDVEGVTARMNHGVLTVTLPRLEGEEGRRIEIE